MVDMGGSLKAIFTEYKFAFIAFLSLYILRLIMIGFMGLMPQDAYYYYYSEHLSLSYFDHPPMVAYMLKLFSLVLGKSVLAIKLTDFIITLLSLIAFYRLCLFFQNKSRAVITTIVYGSTFMVTILSINTTPDVPLMLFWTLSLIVFFKAINEEKTIYWILSGILMGLTFDSKYTAVFLVVGAILFLILSKKYRHLLFSYRTLWMLGFFLIAISPILIWNVQNDWISIKYQSTERVGTASNFSFNPKLFLGTLGTQILILFPILLGAIFNRLYKKGKLFISKKEIPKITERYLISFSYPLIIFFFLISFIYWVKLNWIMPGYIAATILVVPFLSRKLINYHMGISVFIHILLLVQIVFYPINLKTDDTWYGWEELAEKVDSIQGVHPDHFIFSNDDYKTTAVLNFYLDNEIYSGNIIGEKGYQFAVNQVSPNSLNGKSAIFINSENKFSTVKNLHRKPKELLMYFEDIEEQNAIVIRDKKGVVLRKFGIYLCHNYTYRPIAAIKNK